METARALPRCEWCRSEVPALSPLSRVRSIDGQPVGEVSQDFRVCAPCYVRLAALHQRVSWEVQTGIRLGRGTHAGRRD